MGVTKIGSDELINALTQLARRSPERLEKALLKMGEEAVRTAKANTPQRTGRARRSIHVGGHPELSGDFAPGADRGWYGDLGNYSGAAGTQTAVEIGSDLFYFVFIEYGGARNPATRPIGRAVDDVATKGEQYILDELAALEGDVGL